MLKIRRYQPEDNKVVKELHYAGIAQMVEMVPKAKQIDIPPQDPTMLDSDLDDIEDVYFNHGDFIVGLEGDEIVAMGAFKQRTPECAEFKRLRIRPDCQRKGYGEVIMRKLIELAAEMGYKEGFLDTLATNFSAQRLFEKCGWVKSGGGKRGPFELLSYSRKLNKGGN
jgi:N-acetylglutamate synthase-like GNAT family acetyltransferase